MQPHAVVGACGGHARQVVHKSRVRRAGGRHDGKDVVGLVRQGGGQRFTREMAARVLSHLDDPDVEHARGEPDGGVHVSRARQPPAAGWPLSATCQSGMPRRGESGEVAAGAPGDEAACGARWPSEQLDDPPQRLVLGVDRAGSRLPDPGEHVRRAGHEVEGHRGARRRRRDVGEIHRIVLRARRGLKDVAKDAQRLGAPDPSRRHGAPGRRGELRGRARRRLRVRWPHDPLRRPLHRGPHELGLVAPYLVNHSTNDASAAPPLDLDHDPGRHQQGHGGERVEDLKLDLRPGETPLAQIHDDRSAQAARLGTGRDLPSSAAHELRVRRAIAGNGGKLAPCRPRPDAGHHGAPRLVERVKQRSSNRGTRRRPTTRTPAENGRAARQWLLAARGDRIPDRLTS